MHEDRLMDLHKPKPWHGLREFLKEYVIIVVGGFQGSSSLSSTEIFDAENNVWIEGDKIK